MKKFLVVRFSSLGDIVLTSVVTQQLKRQYHHSEIIFLTKGRYHCLARLLPGVSRVVSINRESGLLNHVLQLSQEKFDWVIDLHSNWRSFWVRKLVPAKGATRYNSRRFTRIRMVESPQTTNRYLSTSQAYLESLTPLGITAPELRPLLILKPEDHKHADAFLNACGLSPEIPLIGIAPGARWETKRWHTQRFADVARKLQQIHRARVLIFGNNSESEMLADLKSQFQGSLVIQGRDLDLVAALINHCGCLISNDSGLMHISAALGIPTVAIFGPTHPKLGFAPRGDHTKVLTTNQPCSPCSLHGKKKCHQPSRYCLDNITVEMAAEAACNLMERFRPAWAENEK